MFAARVRRPEIAGISELEGRKLELGHAMPAASGEDTARKKRPELQQEAASFSGLPCFRTLWRWMFESLHHSSESECLFIIEPFFSGQRAGLGF